MSRIRIKNFGPVKEGFLDNQGWLDIKKITVFTGSQGSGKSTVAKLISSFMWLEKALIRGDMKTPVTYQDFLKLITFHRLGNYAGTTTEIEYEGAHYHISLAGSSNNGKKTLEINKLNNKSVKLPKIMYVPAERNFLSSIENIGMVSNLITGSLQNYSVEFRNAQIHYSGKTIDLPINNTRVIYDQKDHENYLVFEDKRLKLSHASSGFHSMVPLYWITRFLMDFIKQGEKKLLQLLSPDQTVRRNHELNELNLPGLDEKTLRAREKKINEKYVCKYLVNIVEEPEQNLFPSSQQKILYSLLEFNHMIQENTLIMTTHSPYLISYLSIAIQAGYLKNQIIEKNRNGLLQKLFSLVPENAHVNVSDVNVYEFDEVTGTITALPDTFGIPSDKNYLNQHIKKGNDVFDALLELEEEL